MSSWVDFVYRDFWDVPRVLVARLEDGRTIMLDSHFDESVEEYRDFYVVYIIPSNVDLSLSWVGLEEKAERCLGRVPVRSIEFDPTLRKALFLGSAELFRLLANDG